MKVEYTQTKRDNMSTQGGRERERERERDKEMGNKLAVFGQILGPFPFVSVRRPSLIRITFDAIICRIATWAIQPINRLHNLVSGAPFLLRCVSLCLCVCARCLCASVVIVVLLVVPVAVCFLVCVCVCACRCPQKSKSRHLFCCCVSQHRSDTLGVLSTTMNLELLDPFRKQIPDRVDATLDLPKDMHGQPPKPYNREWRSAYHLSFNRRGTYLAVGYATGAVAVHDFLSRTLSGLYPCNKHNKAAKIKGLSNPAMPPNDKDGTGETGKGKDGASEKEKEKSTKKTSRKWNFPNGVSSVTWSRRSRTMLVGGPGDNHVRLIDTTHPLGPEECVTGISKGGTSQPTAKEVVEKDADQQDDPYMGPPKQRLSVLQPEPSDPSNPVKFVRVLHATEIKMKADMSLPDKATAVLQDEHDEQVRRRNEQEKGIRKKNGALVSPTRDRYSYLVLDLPGTAGSSLQVHPKDPTAGMIVMANGDLIVFRAPSIAWRYAKGIDVPDLSYKYTTVWDHTIKEEKVVCAAFSHVGDRIYMATNKGKLVGLDVGHLFYTLSTTSKVVPPPMLRFRVSVGGGSPWNIIVSRNGKHLLLNCSDGALRMFHTAACWESGDGADNDNEEGSKRKAPDIKAKVFQDVVSKQPFVSCDFSGDGEYVVGGVNRQDDKYELYLWNTATGALLDQLTGAQVSLYSVAWHPTRSFLAVATSDGLVDVWGPRMDWTAFAPDFQALPMNVEYVEQEDEFDLVVGKTDHSDDNGDNGPDQDVVDVLAVDKVPVFASDSESESEVFSFRPKSINLMSNRGRGRNDNRTTEE